MKQPIYEIELKAIHCNIELWFNGILIYSHYEENGSVWLDWPINHFILSSGIQNFEVRMIPYSNEKNLSNKVQLELGVHYSDKNDDLDKTEVIERKLIEIPSPESLPIYIHKEVFSAQVPYELEGWKNSVDLSEEKKENILNELLNWKTKILSILKESNLKEYNSVFKRRESEFDKANYSPYFENTMDVFHSKFRDLIDTPNDIYELQFYAKNKVVSLKMPKKLPGFTFNPKTETEESLGVSLILFFHRPQKGLPLEIVK